MQRTLSPNNGCAKTVQLVPLVIPGVFTTDQRPLLGVEPDWHGAVWESQQPLCVDSDPSRKTLAPSLIFFMPLCRPRDLIRCPTNPCGACHEREPPPERTRTAAMSSPSWLSVCPTMAAPLCPRALPLPVHGRKRPENAGSWERSGLSAPGHPQWRRADPER